MVRRQRLDGPIMIMKYFTNDWFFSKLSDDDIEEISGRYWGYIDCIFEKLPFTLKVLSKYVNLHDGVVVESNFNKEKHVLKLELFCGDLQSGYFLLQLHYNGISDQSKNLEKIENFLEICADELEMIDHNHFNHRILLSNSIELQIGFSDISINIINKKPEDYETISVLKRKSTMRMI
jgi:hypothetical protein